MHSEYDIIQSFANFYALNTKGYKGIGDDAAVIPISKTKSLLITKDVLIEDIHFRISYFPPQAIAHKAIHANLSDIAAMGGVPQYILLGISIPPTFSGEWIDDFIDAFNQCAKEHNIILIGGDTTKSPDKLYISITLLGTAESKYIKYRNTAKVGDAICVIGVLGEAHLGLLALEKGIDSFEHFKKAQIYPKAKIREALFIRQFADVHALMDISDGLYIDLQRMLSASNVRAEIDIQAFPNPSADAVQLLRILKEDYIKIMLEGGEDFSLLFTVSAEKLPILKTEFEKRFSQMMHVIGHITEGRGITFKSGEKDIDLNLKPFTHFGEENAI